MSSPVERKTAIVTGANSGLGLECAALLFARGWHVVLACRSRAKGLTARAEIERRGGTGTLDVRELDVGDLSSVRRFVRLFVEERRGAPIDAIVCNAGIQVSGAEPSLTGDGLETTFATNHLGHFLLVRSLLPELSADAGIVFVSSNTHDPKQHTGMPAPKLEDVSAFAHGTAGKDGAMDGRRRYTTSKLCNVVCAYELDRRLRALAIPGAPTVRVNAFDPGMMPGTNLAREYGALARFAWSWVLPVLTLFVPNVNRVQTSARRLALLVDAPGKIPSGTYVSRGRETRSSARSYDERLARDLWNTSSTLAGISADLTREDPTRSSTGASVAT